MQKTQNPHLNLIARKDYQSYIINLILDHKKTFNLQKVKLLDIGGGARWGKILFEKPYIDYHCLDLENQRSNTPQIKFIKGDITDPNLDLKQEFDVVLTKDTFEHILNPWDATPNIIKLLKNCGLFIFLAPFSWRYHSYPYDTFRYSHVGAQYLFERMGKLKKVSSGYIYFGDMQGFWKSKKDSTMDNKPFPKSIEVIYVGKKDDNHQFHISSLDSNLTYS